MQPEIIEKLLQLNHQFYQTFAEHFSATRQRLQPGVVEVTANIPHSARLLDVGCGNGLLAAHLSGRGHTGPYTGIDTASDLIKIAQMQQVPNASFHTANLSDPDWASDLPPASFDYILCFAVLHHLPGENLRIDFLKQVRQLLAPDGRFVLSAWQFLESDRLRQRLVPWERIGITAQQVDEHDFLMDWRRGGEGLRYVHAFSNQELHTLANKTGFKVDGVSTSDGENGKLGLYHVWQQKETSRGR